jgi:methylase of polypeptide subunit release factors
MVLRKGGWIFLEIGDGQGPAVREILEKMGFIEVMIKADLSGKTRYAIARNGN